MHCVDAVKIGNGLCNLFEYSPGSDLSDHSVAQWLHILLQRDAFHKVCHDVYLLGRVNQIVQTNDARILKPFEDGDFSLSCLTLHWICKLVFLIDLHGIFYLVPLVKTETNLRIGTLTNDSAYVIALQLARCVGTSWHVTLLSLLVHSLEEIILRLIPKTRHESGRAIMRLGSSIWWQHSLLRERWPPTIISFVQSRNPVKIWSRCIGMSPHSRSIIDSPWSCLSLLARVYLEENMTFCGGCRGSINTLAIVKRTIILYLTKSRLVHLMLVFGWARHLACCGKHLLCNRLLRLVWLLDLTYSSRAWKALTSPSHCVSFACVLLGIGVEQIVDLELSLRCVNLTILASLLG